MRGHPREDRRRSRITAATSTNRRMRSTSRCPTRGPARARPARCRCTGSGTSAPIPITATPPTPASRRRCRRRATWPRATVLTRWRCARPPPVLVDARRAGDRAVSVRARMRGRARRRHGVHQRRGGAVHRGQSGQSEQLHRRVAAGPLVERRRARTRARAYSQDGGGTWTRSPAPMSRCTGGSRRTAAIRARVRPVGHVRARTAPRTRSRSAFNNQTERRQRDPRRALDRRRPHVEQCGHASPRYAAEPERQGIGHRRSDRRALRLRGLGPADRQQRAHVVRAHDRRRRRLGSRARSIYDPGANRQTINNQIVVLPDGTLILFFTELATVGAPNPRLRIMRSTDKGATWSAPITISERADGRHRRSGHGYGHPRRLDPRRHRGGQGRRRSPLRGRTRASLPAPTTTSRSPVADGGLTWSAPVRINGDHAGARILPTRRHPRRRRHRRRATTTCRATRRTPPRCYPIYWLATSSDGVDVDRAAASRDRSTMRRRRWSAAATSSATTWGWRRWARPSCRSSPARLATSPTAPTFAIGLVRHILLPPALEQPVTTRRRPGNAPDAGGGCADRRVDSRRAPRAQPHVECALEQRDLAGRDVVHAADDVDLLAPRRRPCTTGGEAFEPRHLPPHVLGDRVVEQRAGLASFRRRSPPA